jgi:hypothetical protein
MPIETHKIEMRLRSLALLLIVLSTFSCDGIRTVCANKPARVPLQKELTGSWVGYDESCLHFYRLVLQERGIGSCFVLFKEEVAGVYDIAWRVGTEGLLLTFRPTNRESEAILLTVTYVDLMRIETVVGGVARKWERKVCFYNERELLNRLHKCTQGQKPAKKVQRPGAKAQ